MYVYLQKSPFVKDDKQRVLYEDILRLQVEVCHAFLVSPLFLVFNLTFALCHLCTIFFDVGSNSDQGGVCWKGKSLPFGIQLRCASYYFFPLLCIGPSPDRTPQSS